MHVIRMLEDPIYGYSYIIIHVDFEKLWTFHLCKQGTKSIMFKIDPVPLTCEDVDIHESFAAHLKTKMNVGYPLNALLMSESNYGYPNLR